MVYYNRICKVLGCPAVNKKIEETDYSPQFQQLKIKLRSNVHCLLGIKNKVIWCIYNNNCFADINGVIIQCFGIEFLARCSIRILFRTLHKMPTANYERNELNKNPTSESDSK